MNDSTISFSMMTHSWGKMTPKRNKSMRLTSNDDNNLSRQLRYDWWDSLGSRFGLAMGAEMGMGHRPKVWQWIP